MRSKIACFTLGEQNYPIVVIFKTREKREREEGTTSRRKHAIILPPHRQEYGRQHHQTLLTSIPSGQTLGHQPELWILCRYLQTLEWWFGERLRQGRGGGEVYQDGAVTEYNPHQIDNHNVITMATTDQDFADRNMMDQDIADHMYIFQYQKNEWDMTNR